MKMVSWLILAIAMFFSSCGEDSTLPPSEMGKTKERPPRQGLEDGPVAKQTATVAELNLPAGQPLELLVEGQGGYFLGEETTPFSGAVEKRHENGKLAFWANYENGQPDGGQYHWDSNGQKLQEATFSEGMLDGAQTFWWPDGTKKEERIWAKGEYRELRKWNRGGELIEETKNF